MIDKFIEIEKKYNLFEQEIYNIKIWHYIRFNVYMMILRKNDLIENQQNNLYNNLIKKGFKLLKQFKYFFKSRYKINNLDLIIINHPRRVKKNNYYECLYTEDLVINQHKYSTLVVETPYQNMHYEPIQYNNIIYTDILDFKVATKYLFYKFVGLSKKINYQNQKFIDYLTYTLEEELKLKIDKHKLNNLIYRSVVKYPIYKKYYEKLVSKAKPKAIVQVVSYSFESMVINAIARKYEIPSIELQHGVMGNKHIAYNFADKYNLDTFPSYIFLYGQFWKDNTRLPINKENIIVTGWPFYERELLSNKNIQLQKEIKKKTIVFMSQGTIGHLLSKLALELSLEIDLSKYDIIYKLHPGEYNEWKNRYPWLINSSMNIIDNNLKDIHYYLKNADIQIGVSSTVLFEGLGYNLETYVYKIFSHEYMEVLYSNGYAKLINSVNDLIESLISNTNINNTIDSSYFWENNSFKKIMDSIDRISRG